MWAPGISRTMASKHPLLASECVNIKVGFLMKARYHDMSLLSNYLLRFY